jgi:hypothetical protein
MLEMLAGILGGIVIAVGGSVGYYYWQRNVVERLSVKRIRSSSDKHVEGLLELYEENFLQDDDGSNYSLDEIAEFINAKPEAKRKVDVENITLAALLKDEVVGLTFCHHYPERRKAIVSYFAIKKESAPKVRYEAAPILLAALKRWLLKEYECDILFFELQSSNATTSGRARPGRGKARRGNPARRYDSKRDRFKQRARTAGFQVREFQFPYQCAKVSLSEGTRELPFTLFAVGIQEKVPAQVSKQQMLDYLRFIYLDCYGDIYAEDDPRFEAHQEYLSELIRHYEKTLPETIPTVA